MLYITWKLLILKDIKMKIKHSIIALTLLFAVTSAQPAQAGVWDWIPSPITWVASKIRSNWFVTNAKLAEHETKLKQAIADSGAKIQESVDQNKKTTNQELSDLDKAQTDLRDHSLELHSVSNSLEVKTKRIEDKQNAILEKIRRNKENQKLQNDVLDAQDAYITTRMDKLEALLHSNKAKAVVVLSKIAQASQETQKLQEQAEALQKGISLDAEVDKENTRAVQEVAHLLGEVGLKLQHKISQNGNDSSAKRFVVSLDISRCLSKEEFISTSLQGYSPVKNSKD